MLSRIVSAHSLELLGPDLVCKVGSKGITLLIIVTSSETKIGPGLVTL